ncbi:MAG: hypothetical protein IT381_14645 [Deltaproteobacteria bacterium]|nr:hypothetical protein [Deltaproteobacteria bacterium]
MTDKPKDKVAGWSSTLEDEEDEQGVQRDIARKILAMNPSLREAGMDTMRAVEQSKARDPKAAATSSGQKASAGRVVDAIAEGKQKLDSEEKRIDQELLRLQKERAGLKAVALDRFMRWLAVNDPELRSPVTKQTLEDEKAFLTKLGFKGK